MNAAVSVRRILATVLLLPGAWNALALWRPAQDSLPNLDRRPTMTNARPAVELASALTRMRRELPLVRVDFDARLGTPAWVRAEHGFLSGPLIGSVAASSRAVASNDEAYLPTKEFLREHADLFGHGPEVLDQATVKREFTTSHNGLRTVIWEQRVDGVPVFGGLMISHATTRGELVSISSQFLPQPMEAAQRGTPERASAAGTNSLTAREAVWHAAQDLGEPMELASIVPSAEPDGDELRRRFQADTLNEEAEASLVWLPFSRDSMRLCWQVILTSRKRGEMYRVLVDTQTGAALLRHCLTEYVSAASYRVFPSDSPSPSSPGCAVPCTLQPPVVPRVLVSWSALDTNASPNGWIDDGVNELRGNNVSAQTDRDFNNAPDLPRPQGVPFRNFDFPLDLTQSPSNSTSAAVSELFYWCNWMHDRLYGLGFTEAAGNLQTTNFGRGGLSGDALQADAQDGIGINNANMSTPPDGAPARMQVFLFTGPTPQRDGALDQELVLHEYTHALSNRRVGGGIGLTDLQSRGLGEGWSDFYALALLSETGDDPNANYPFGGYVGYLLRGLSQNYYYGIRRYPYSTDLSRNPLTFKDIDPAQASSHPTVPRNPVITQAAEAVHNVGEIWCSALWDARANLIAKYGHSIGNETILRLVTDAMNLTPANPNFVQARDAILQADLVNYNGANLGELWLAFAKRGLGFGAIAPPSFRTDGVVESFDVPDGLVVSPLTEVTITGPAGGPFNPAFWTVSLVNISNDELSWVIGQTADWIQSDSTEGTLAVGTVHTVNFTLSAVANALAAGNHTNVLWFTNVTGGLAQSRLIVLRIGQPGYFTELFDAADNDVMNQILTFVPDGSANHYSVCREPAEAFPTDPAAGEWLPLGAHTNLQLTTPQNITLYGLSTNVIFLNSEGHITLIQPDASGQATLANHFSLPRISGSAAHLHPTEEGGAVSWRLLEDRAAITFSNAWEYGTSNRNGFQIEMFYDGRLRLTHLAMGSRNGLIGLARGTGIPPGFTESDLSAYGPCALPLLVKSPTQASEGDGLLNAQGTIQFFSPMSTNVLVRLTSSDQGELIVPPQVSLPAGETSVLFDLGIVDDHDLDGAKTVTITASAAGFAGSQTTMLIRDDETTQLSLEIPTSVSEGAGTLSVRVSAAAPPTTDTLVYLESSDVSELQTPLVTTLPAGATTTDFAATMVNDLEFDGDQIVTLTAAAVGWSPAVVQVMVQDDEAAVLSLALPESAREGDGLLGGAGRVNIPGTLATNLVVQLESSDITELIVPEFVTIPLGHTQAAFGLIIVNDSDSDGAQPVNVTARAIAFLDAHLFIVVNDDELPPLPSVPSPPHLATDVSPNVHLNWQSGARPGEVFSTDVYFGTNGLPGPTDLAGTTTNSSWPLPALQPMTTYYWQVVARTTGVTPGPIWQFTTGVEPDHALAPVILEHPTNTSVTLGAPAFFRVTASGLEPLAYQWRRNGTPIHAATDRYFTINSATTDDLGFYSVWVTNTHGSAVSSNAQLTLAIPEHTVLNQGDLTVTIFNAGARIESLQFLGAELFRVGTHVSDWGLQIGTNDHTFRRNHNGEGGIGQAMTLLSTSPTNARYAGNYTASGADVALTRHYLLPGGLNLLRTITTMRNDGAAPIVLRCFDTFDVDHSAQGSIAYFAEADRYALVRGPTTAQFARSVLTNNHWVVLLGTTDPLAVLAASTLEYFGIATAADLNAHFANGGADSDGAVLDATLDIAREFQIAPGATATFIFDQAVATDAAQAEAALIAQLGLPPDPLRFEAARVEGGELVLILGTLGGSPISPHRAAGIRFYANTQLLPPPANWSPVTVATVLTNGVLEVRGLSPSNADQRFFLAAEKP